MDQAAHPKPEKGSNWKKVLAGVTGGLVGAAVLGAGARQLYKKGGTMQKGKAEKIFDITDY